MLDFVFSWLVLLITMFYSCWMKHLYFNEPILRIKIIWDENMKNVSEKFDYLNHGINRKNANSYNT